MRRTNHRSLRRLALVAALALAAAATALGAGQLGRQTDRNRAHRQPRQPRFAIMEGVLAQDRYGGWSLQDGTTLNVARDVAWREARDGRRTGPAVGRTAQLLGQWYGNAFTVRQATLLAPERVAQRLVAPPEAPADQSVRELPQ